MTTKRTKKTETTEAKTNGTDPVHLHATSLQIEEVDNNPLRDDLGDLISEVRTLNSKLTQERAALDEYQIKPWYLLLAFALGAWACTLGSQSSSLQAARLTQLAKNDRAA